MIRSSSCACLLWFPYSPYSCSLLVEKGVILVLLREVLRYELKESFADVSFHTAVKRRIIPDHVTPAASTWSIILSVFVVT